MAALLYFIFGVAIATSPMTALRTDQGYGVTDIALLASGVLVLLHALRARRPQNSDEQSVSLVSRFWLLGFPLLTLSTMAGVALGHTPLVDAFLQYRPYVLITLCVLALGAVRPDAFGLRTLLVGYLSTNLLMGIAYILMFTSGANAFLFGDRFDGLSINPNETAMQAMSCVVVCIIFLARYPEDSRIVKAAIVFTAALAVVYGLATKSDAAKVTLMVLVATATLWASFNLARTNRAVLVALGTLALVGLSFLAFSGFDVMDGLRSMLREGGDQADLRYVVWGNGIRAGLASPVLGNGAGAWSGFYSPFEGEESHNLWIDWFSMTGFLGFIPMAYAVVSIVGRGRRFTWANWLALLSILPVAAVHSPLRHIEFWLALDLATSGLGRSALYPTRAAARTSISAVAVEPGPTV
jgi:O-antigen ligase